MHAIDLTARQEPSPFERRVDLVMRVAIVAIALLWLLPA